MNKQQLASRIWESANKMRSKIEANEYKDYILGFIFYKFLSDREVDFLKKNDWEEEDFVELVEEDTETVNQCRRSLGYFISYKNLFSTWLGMGKNFDVSNVTDALSAFDRLINESHKNVFDGIFDTLQTGLSKLGETSNAKRIVFIVDECHRSVFGEMLSTIKHTFPRAIFIGFSGTPILEINKKKDTTTADVFGNELEGTRYTVADGMRDGNVLGFDTIPQPTYKDKNLRLAIALDKAKVRSEAEVFGNPAKEAIYNHWMNEVPMGAELGDNGEVLESIEGQLTDAQYDREQHRKAVVDDILENWISQSHNGKFHAMLATSSIPEAIQYYKEIRSRNRGLKITAVFDPHDGNHEGSIEKIDGIKEILEDYNHDFSVRFNIPGYAAFKRDVCARLAHKDAYVAIENEPEKCLDILIVVDQMLTGYDSKWLNTLYMDKFYKWSNIEMIIQAFSRTNRVFTEDKPHGIIRYYRRPYTMKNVVEYAFEQYSGNKPYGIFVPKLKENLESMNRCFEEIKTLFESAGISDFYKLPDEKAEKQKFSKLFRELNKHLEPAKVQGFVWKQTSYEIEQPGGVKEIVCLEFDQQTFEILLARYKELRRPGPDGGCEEEACDIEPYLMALSTEKIDSDYMDSRFKKYVKMLNENADEETIHNMLNELHRSFASLTQEEQKFANILLKDIQNHELIVSEDKSVRDYIVEYQIRAKSDQIHNFASRLGMVVSKTTCFFVPKFNKNLDFMGECGSVKYFVFLKKMAPFW